MATDPWRSLGKPTEGETTATLLQRSQCLVDLATVTPEVSLRPVLCDNFRDNVYLSFQAETKVYLRRFFVRCDHLQGLTVDDLRKHFDHVFRVKRGNATSEDESDQITAAETFYQRILVHLVHYLYTDLRATNLQLGSISVGVHADLRNDLTLGKLITQHATNAKHIPQTHDDAVMSSALLRQHATDLLRVNPSTGQTVAVNFSARLADDTGSGFPSAKTTDVFIQAILSHGKS